MTEFFLLATRDITPCFPLSLPVKTSTYTKNACRETLWKSASTDTKVSCYRPRTKSPRTIFQSFIGLTGFRLWPFNRVRTGISVNNWFHLVVDKNTTFFVPVYLHIGYINGATRARLAGPYKHFTGFDLSTLSKCACVIQCHLNAATAGNDSMQQ